VFKTYPDLLCLKSVSLPSKLIGMNVLILGSGGREHAFAWKISQSPLLSQLYVAPGNAGTKAVSENVEIDILNFPELKSFVLSKNISLVLVGPEIPLVEGIVDYFKSDRDLKNIMIIGPSKLGAQLEGSKDFSKHFMLKYNIPTARYSTFTIDTLEEGKKFLETLKPPYVLKADGLAAGKGVLIPTELEEAKKSLETLLFGQFGEASSKVVIEEFLPGIEMSAFVITDGVSYKILPEAKDYKRIGVGDTGLNTGGMGAVSPVPFASESFLKKLEERVIKPTINGLRSENIPYVGFVFFGIMVVNDDPFVIEYNCRMGDPETEVVVPRIKNDLLEILIATANGKLDSVIIETDKRFATTVMLVSGGYPEDYQKNKIIREIENVKEVFTFHAGTTSLGNDIVTSGGRVLAITAIDDEIKTAIMKSMTAAQKIEFDGKYYRTDIGLDVLKFI